MYSWDTLFIESCLCCCTVWKVGICECQIRNKSVHHVSKSATIQWMWSEFVWMWSEFQVWMLPPGVAVLPPPQTASSQVENRLTSQIVHEFSRETSGGGWKKSRNLKKYIEYNMWRHDNYTSHFPYSHTSHSQHRYFGMQENFQCGFGIFN